MVQVRRHERAAWLRAATLRPLEGGRPVAAHVLNLSRGGAALCCAANLDPGALVRLEVMLPLAAGPPRRAVVFGKVEWTRILPEGNFLGLRFLADDLAGDYRWLVAYLRAARTAGRKPPASDWRAPTGPPRLAPARGFTLMEACLALVIICLMATMAMPIYRQALEQGRLDAAGASLRTVWSAQRIYWMEYRAFAPNLNQLYAMDLVSPNLVQSVSDPKAPFVYQVNAAGSGTFSATAIRNGSGIWAGSLQIDESGQVTGCINGPGGTVLSPAS